MPLRQWQEVQKVLRCLMAGYRLAPVKRQNFDSRYGNGLNGPSRKKIEEIVRFLFTVEALERPGMKSPFTSRQGQFLAFIHQFTTLHAHAPAEAEMEQFFHVTPPSVHQMILTLERCGMITRTPGVARSIRLNVSPENLPPLKSGAATATIPLPTEHHAEEQQPADTEAAVVRLGRIQMEDLFAHYHQNSLDDSEFMPLLDTLIGSFARAGLGALAVKELRRHACELYHRCCQDAEPESSFEANMELMFTYLPGPIRTHWRR
jgi:DNA-binding MarR family transcriptional regulator